MTKFFLTCALILSCVCFIIFYEKSDNTKLPYDHEQTGLNEQITLRFSHVVAENTPKGLAAQKFADLVEEKTQGKVKVEIYPNGVLYSDDTEVDALRNNDVQMIAPSISKVTELASNWEVLDLPFLFKNEKHVQNVLTGSIGKQLVSMVHATDVNALTFWGNGFKQMTSNNQELIHPNDFTNERFRVSTGSIIKKQFQLLGAQPVVLPFNDVFRSLEKHDVNGQENTISNIYSKGLYKVQNYLTISNHGYLGYVILVNQSFWDKLPDPLQKDVKNALTETSLWTFEQSKLMNDAALEKIKTNSSLNIHTLSTNETQEWIYQFAPLYEQITNKVEKSLIKAIQTTNID